MWDLRGRRLGRIEVGERKIIDLLLYKKRLDILVIKLED